MSGMNGSHDRGVMNAVNPLPRVIPARTAQVPA